MSRLRKAAARVKLSFSAADMWHDLPPGVRRMIIGGAAGGLTGAGLGAAVDSEHRGRGAAIGGLGGLALGAGGGALYDKLRPVVPLSAGGLHEVQVGASARGYSKDYADVLKPSDPAGASRTPAPYWHADDDLARSGGYDEARWRLTPEDGIPYQDVVGRSLTVNPKPYLPPELRHLELAPEVMRDSALRRKLVYRLKGVPRTGIDKANGNLGDYGHWAEIPHELYGVKHDHTWVDHSTDAVRHAVPLRYSGPLEHDSTQSPAMNEMRRRLRVAAKKKPAPGPVGAAAPLGGVAIPPERVKFLRDSVDKFRQDYVDYYTWLEGVRQNLHSRDIDTLLAGRKKQLAAPVLYLHHKDWLWSGKELDHGVEQVLKGFGIPGVATQVNDPTHRADAAVASWALNEARRRIAAHRGA